ncbi:MAG TPA: hypothetical protein VHK67_06475 [Rhabdochlamydiaceae bacterium]|jgi:hypothetical protein|nr:hypothetical protein [Rhabdochlamydiaceae bacterium]
MKTEKIGPSDKNQRDSNPEEAVWNGRKVSTFQKIRELELVKLRSERPSKTLNPQDYFNYRAREEQIKYELELRQYCFELLTGHLVDAAVHFGRAQNHLKRRNEYEEKTYAVWLERLKAQENPPQPDILFINQGIRTDRLLCDSPNRESLN